MAPNVMDDLATIMEAPDTISPGTSQLVLSLQRLVEHRHLISVYSFPSAVDRKKWMQTRILGKLTKPA